MLGISVANLSFTRFFPVNFRSIMGIAKISKAPGINIEELIK
jgi:hypothetical protein